MNLLQFFWSLYYLKPSQIFWRIHRIIKRKMLDLFFSLGFKRQENEAHFPSVRSDFPILTSQIHHEDIDIAKRRFTFLDDSLILPAAREERNDQIAAQSLLWQFHYHYQDFLIPLIEESPAQENASLIVRFIESWIEDYPFHRLGSMRAAWHPYVLSLRIEAWIRLITILREKHIQMDGQVYRKIILSLYLQGKILSENLEWGTLANHLYRNLKALILFNVFFTSKNHEESLQRTLQLFDKQLLEQVLSDGCHFERSPMYHLSVLTDVLDVMEALNGSHKNFISSLMISKTHALHEFLRRILHPDGEYPYFNDSTGSQFLRTSEVLQRAENLLPQFPDVILTSRSNSFPASVAPQLRSGIHVHRRESVFLAFDAGFIGPEYQPGHAHADTLSYELSWRGKRWITDTGIIHYKKSPERRYSRSTPAHNTITIDSKNQSDVWDSFRVGRRAKILFDKEYDAGSAKVFHAAHDGYARFYSRLIHERAMICCDDRSVVVVDWLHGPGKHHIESFLHFHPMIVVAANGGDGFSTTDGVDKMFVTFFDSELETEIRKTPYYPAFGKSTIRNSIALHGIISFPHITAYALTPGQIQLIIHLDRQNNLLQIQSNRNESVITIRSFV